MNTSRLSRSTAVALVAMAFAAPVAGADDHFKDSRSADVIASGVEPRQDYRGADAQGAPTDAPSQNYRGADAQGAPTDAPKVVVLPITRPAPTTSDSIDWTDTLVGAGGALGLSLVFLGGTLLVVNRRRPRLTA